MKSLLLAFQFLTIFPVQIKGTFTERDMGKAVAFFPSVGAIQGLLIYTSSHVFRMFFNIEISASLVVCVLLLSNGCLHLDGLADTFDALAVSNGDTKKKLAVMKDSTSGPVGILSIVMVVLIKFLSLKTLMASYDYTLFLMPLIGRWSMVPAIFLGRTARQKGLGSMFMRHTGIKEVLFASLSALLLTLLTAGFLGLLYFSCISLFSCLMYQFFQKKFGGLTGDALGAICELSEVVFLLVHLAWVQEY